MCVHWTLKHWTLCISVRVLPGLSILWRIPVLVYDWMTKRKFYVGINSLQNSFLKQSFAFDAYFRLDPNRSPWMPTKLKSNIYNLHTHHTILATGVLGSKHKEQKRKRYRKREKRRGKRWNLKRIFRLMKPLFRNK